MDLCPIGIFDSGVGGLTVACAIIDQFPEESITYIGDTAHTPYGLKPIAWVRELALDIMDSFVDLSVKMLVIICNSASVAVLHDARERYQAVRLIPVVEVIQPAVRRAVSATWSRRIDVTGTEATTGPGVYGDVFAAAPCLTLTTAVCPEFVELVEAGITTGPRVEEVTERYLAPVYDAGVNTFVFGYMYYPLLVGVIGYTMGKSVTLASSADETACDVYAELASRDLLTPPGNESDRCPYATEDPTRSGELAGGFLGPEVGATRLISQTSSGVSV